MIDPWNDWASSPPPLITCQIREGLTGSVPLVVMDEDEEVFENVYRDEDGQCRFFGGGRIGRVVKWTYAPGAWDGVVIDVAAVELRTIRRLQDAGALPAGDPERIANNLIDGTAEAFLADLEEMREEATRT